MIRWPTASPPGPIVRSASAAVTSSVAEHRTGQVGRVGEPGGEPHERLRRVPQRRRAVGRRVERRVGVRRRIGERVEVAHAATSARRANGRPT